VRIVQAVGWYLPDRVGGTEIYVAALCRHLAAAGHQVLVAAPEAGAAAARAYDHEGVPVFRYPIPRAPTRAEAQGLVAVRGADLLHGWLLRERPDVVHFHTVGTGLGLAEIRAARAAGARVIATSHAASLGFTCLRGTMMRWGERVCDGITRPRACAACALEHRGVPRALAHAIASIPPRLGRHARRLSGRIGTALAMTDLVARNQILQRDLLALVDRFVVLTEWARRVLVENGAPPAKLALSRLGVDGSAFARKPCADERPTRRPVTVGYLGRFERIKGAPDLARAVASLPRDAAIRVEFRGPIADASDQACVRDLRALLDGDSRVAFAPAVAHEAVPGVLARYDVLCCPSVCLEGGPTVAIEAHAVGTPVIGTRIGGLAELVDDGRSGRLVAPGDWRALAGLLADIARDPATTVDRWRRSLPRARRMDEVAAEHLTLYEDALR